MYQETPWNAPSAKRSIADVESAVRLVMANAQEHGRWLAGNETAVRYAWVDPSLWALCWRTWSSRQCLPNFGQGQRGPADYALFDPDGNVAVLIMVGTEPARRRTDRQRLTARAPGMNLGVAVLTYGTQWEIYDLHLRPMRFTGKLVENLFLDRDRSKEVARALHYWLRQDLWWDDSP